MSSINTKAEIYPQTYARIGGVLYLLLILLGIFYEIIVKNKLIVSGNALATMDNLKAMEHIWRLGISAQVLSIIIGLMLVLIMYKLTKPVNKDMAILAAIFNLVATTIQAVYILKLVEVLFPLDTSAFLSAFTSEQLSALLYLTIKSHVVGFGIALLMFGPYFILTGILIFKSSYLPKFVAILYIISGLGYLVNGFTLILAPELSDLVFTIIVLPVFAGELSLALTLLIRGVNLAEWKKFAL